MFEQYYMRVKRDIVRLESETRAPILNLVGDTVRGLPSIRSMKLESFLENKMTNNIEENLKNSLLIFGLDMWQNLQSILSK